MATELDKVQVPAGLPPWMAPLLVRPGLYLTAQGRTEVEAQANLRLLMAPGNNSRSLRKRLPAARTRLGPLLRMARTQMARTRLRLPGR